VIDLLPRADVVVMCMPLNAVTRKLAGEQFFAAMKPGAVFVNVGRGGTVDEAALLTGLDMRRPAHAILDVFAQEPLPSHHPFWLHPRVVITPHVSPLSDGQLTRNDALFLENLRRYCADAPLLNVANPNDVLNA
jgi:phosphoglycerate dehydrogenase-like enzyme